MLNDHHIETARLPAQVAVAAVRVAVQRMPGARWIDLEAHSDPLSLSGWVIVYPRGRSTTPDTEALHELQRKVEAMAIAALVGADKPF